MRKALLAAAVALGLVAAVSTAAADIPAPDGTIHGCYDTQHPFEGALVVIDSGATCPTGTETLNWSQVGPPGLAGVERVTASSQPFVGSNGTASVTANCPSGKSAVGGGLSVNGGFPNIEVHQSLPAADLSGWIVQVFNSQGAQFIDISAYAICAVVDP